MRWYFALNAKSIVADDLYAQCVEVAVLSAVRHTSLEPHFIFDGEECALTRYVRALGGKVIFHRSSLYDAIRAVNSDNADWQRIAQGAYLRLDVPLLDMESEYALYTDCDVMFLKDPTLDHLKPRFFSVAPEFTHGDFENMNSGVMLMNLPKMREIWGGFRQYVIQGLAGFPAFDQGAFRAYFKGIYDYLPETLNWKPYWGENDDAEILHFHGPKPPQVRTIQADPSPSEDSILVRLYNQHPSYYTHSVDLWEDYLTRARQTEEVDNELMVAPNNPMPDRHFQFSIATCARWETDVITEWILYHQSLGFDHFYIYCNDDDPAELYAKLLPFMLGEAPLVTFYHFPIQGQQLQMLRHYLLTHREETEWVMFLDIDEFLSLPQENNIGRFVANMPPEANSIYINWLFFGNSGHRERAQGSTLTNYTRRSASPHVFTKTLTRARAIDASIVDATRSIHFWHSWGEEIGQRMGAVNVLGDPMFAYMRNFPHDALRFINEEDRISRLIARASVHHYAFRSEDEFVRRANRGLGGEFAGQKDWKDLYDSGKIAEFLAPLNEVEDVRLARYWSEYTGNAWDRSIIPRPRGRNVAVGCHATQSSISPWSRFQNIEQDAAGAVSGHIGHTYQCHTNLETDPWWQLDLGQMRAISEIRVYNRCDAQDIAERTRHLKVETSIDGVSWKELYRRQSDTAFGGVDGNPLIIAMPNPEICISIRITVLGTTFLHFDQVEAYEI